MYRSGEYDALLSKELQDPKFAQGFLLDLMEGEDGLPLEEALRHTIRRMGVKEFSSLVSVPTSNVHEFLNEKRKLKPETLDQYLRPFQLKTKLVVEKAS